LGIVTGNAPGVANLIAEQVGSCSQQFQWSVVAPDAHETPVAIEANETVPEGKTLIGGLVISKVNLAFYLDDTTEFLAEGVLATEAKHAGIRGHAGSAVIGPIIQIIQVQPCLTIYIPLGVRSHRMRCR
jgi:hypothetical protein